MRAAVRPEPAPPRVAFVSNFVAHYRVRMFEALAAMCDLQCYFCSDGGEWYWQRAHGVTHSTGFKYEYLPGFWLGRVRIVLRLPRVLLFDRRNQVFIKCINDKFALPVTWLVARCTGRPFILWTGVWVRLTTPVQRLLWPLTRRLYVSSDAIVVYGAHVRRYLIGEGVDPRRIFLAPQAVDNALYRRATDSAAVQDWREGLQIPTGAKVLLFLGRLEPVKGLEVLLAAFALLRARGVVLALCGTGSLLPALRVQSQALGISESVRFAGYVPHADSALCYGSAWALVLPSVSTPAGRETWGLVVNEAFNHAVPVITTVAVGAAAGGLVVHNRNGLVVPEQDAAALAGAMQRLVEELGLRDTLGQQARADVAEWTQERMARGFRDAVDFVLHRDRQETSS